MLLSAKDLVTKTTKELISERQKIKTRPGMALIWVGNDAQTKTFIRVKQQKAKQLDCDFYLYHLEDAKFDQLAALMRGLNRKKEIHGIVLQLPLPRKEETQALIDLMSPAKDIDHLRPDSLFDAPTPSGILAILSHHGINPAKQRTAILGAGRLVGAPLAEMFTKNNWNFIQIPRRAKEHLEEIRHHDILISGTGVSGLVTPTFIGPDMVVVDGSGIDVDVPAVEKVAKAVTPSKGAVGPMTVCFLFRNLLLAAKQA